MAEKKSQTSADRRLWRNIVIVLLALLLAAAAAGFGLLAAWRTLFTGNDRFLLRNLVLTDTAPGYWSAHPSQLPAVLRLTPGKDNIFALRLGELRRRLLAVPSVESCEIRRIMPDTLAISIVERIPRAAIDNPRSPWVVDASGMIIPRNEAMPITGFLPVITGFGNRIRPMPGVVFTPALPAMELLMTTIRNYPDFSIIFIDASTPEKLNFTFRYRNRHLYRATIPSRTSPGYRLGMLQQAIISAQRSGDQRTTFDLTFDESVILR